jgi:hypothetical protein
MSAVLWMNIPLMVLAFGLMVGIPLWMVMRRSDWHGKQGSNALPAYLACPDTPVRASMVRVYHSTGRDGRFVRPVTGGANG